MKKDHSKLNLTLVLNMKRLKETERALKYELAKNKAMIENSKDCIKILDKKGNILYMNKGGLEEHDFKNAQQAIGWDWLSSLEKPYRKKAINTLKKCLKGLPTTIDVKHLPAGSKREWCSITMTPIKNERGKIIQVLAISRDLTQRKRAEKKFKAKIKKLEKLLKKKTKTE